jgi:peptidoglycan/LPS O-acetylase OafA/YrhL
VIGLALAALLIGVSGFLFGSGPESIHAGVWAAVAYAAAVIACVVVPFAGFVINRRGNAGAGLLIAWVPPLGGLLALIIPPPYSRPFPRPPATKSPRCCGGLSYRQWRTVSANNTRPPDAAPS